MLVMDVAGAWYSSGTLWTGVVVPVLCAAAVVWVTLRVGFPRRRLYYGLRAVAPLLSAPAGMRSDLELRRRGKLLEDPYVLTVELVSRGRRDIPNEAYNNGEPLQLDVGSRIVEILQVRSKPETVPVPKIALDGTSLKIGPSLINKRHELTINVLTDGGTHSLTCSSPLIDVQVRPRSDERLAVRRFAVACIVVVALAVVVITSFVTLWVGGNIDSLTRLLEIIFAPIVAVVAVALGFYYRSSGQPGEEMTRS